MQNAPLKSPWPGTPTRRLIHRQKRRDRVFGSEEPRRIGGVGTAAKNTTQGANDTMTASLQLSEMAARLQAAVAKFTFWTGSDPSSREPRRGANVGTVQQHGRNAKEHEK